jgi:preprotein translocase subunit SecA
MLGFLKSALISREVSNYRREAEEIVRLSQSMSGIPTESIAQNFQNLRGRYDRKGLYMALAMVIEMSERTLGLRPYLVQVMGALAMFDGKIAEMATGEGKTLTAALTLAARCLNGRAHAMTVNDYLAKRDALFLDPLYEGLGLSSGYLQSDMGSESRQIAYKSSIVYGTPSQFVFDYLRDNVAYRFCDTLQQERDFILIDEADSILIDEARTPLILSGEGDLDTELWDRLRDLIAGFSAEQVLEDNRPQLERAMGDLLSVTADIAVDHKHQNATVTDQGIEKIERFFVDNHIITSAKELWQPSRSYLWRAISATVKARHVYLKDRDYIVRDGRVIIVDQETGRLSNGKRWNDGLHQAVESKEHLEIKPETIEVGRIALANFMALYPVVSGMTGTAMTVSDEIGDLYKLNVVPIPTHKPNQRRNHNDLIFMSRPAKWQMLVDDVQAIHATGQPILIGTASVDDSELLSEKLTEKGLPHKVLNAKQDEAEASIIAQAGRLHAITIATSMAGRGTDILLGGNPDFLEEGEHLAAIEENKKAVLKAGGLFVIGSERLESRRLDLQLAGRSGRQGDPGDVRFYVALDDPLMKHFGGETMRRLFMRMGITEQDGVEHSMVDNAIAKAQHKKQALYMDSRKTGLEQDSVIAAPRQVVYQIREQTLRMSDEQTLDAIKAQVEAAVRRMAKVYCGDFITFEETWDLPSLKAKLQSWGLSVEWFERIYEEQTRSHFNAEAFIAELIKWIEFDLGARTGQLLKEDPSAIRVAQLMAIDFLWRGFLDDSEHVRAGIHLRAYAQEKPHLSLKKEVFSLFQQLHEEMPVAMLDYTYSAIIQVEQAMDAAADSDSSSVEFQDSLETPA